MKSFIRHNIDLITIATILSASAGLGALFTQRGLAWFHQDLLLPALTPPDWVFSVAWTIIFMCASAAAFFLSRLYRHTNTWRLIVGLFVLASFLTFGWNYIFFCAHNIHLALIDAVLFQLLVLLAISATWAQAREVSFLLMPCALWLLYAIYLNYHIMLLNAGM